MNIALVLKCILEIVGLFLKRQDLEQLTTLQSSRKPPTKCWQAIIFKWCPRSCWVGPQNPVCSGCVGKLEYPGWNRISGRMTLPCLLWCNINCLSGNMRRFFLSGRLAMKPLLCALVPVQSVFENLTSWKVLFNILRFCIDTAIFILICFSTAFYKLFPYLYVLFCAKEQISP